MPRQTTTGSADGGKRRQVLTALLTAFASPVALALFQLLTPTDRAGRRARGPLKGEDLTESIKKQLKKGSSQKSSNLSRCKTCGQMTVGGLCTNPKCVSRELRG